MSRNLKWGGGIDEMFWGCKHVLSAIAKGNLKKLKTEKLQ